MKLKPVRKNNDVVLEIDWADTPLLDIKKIDSITIDAYEAKSLAYSILSIVSHIQKDREATTKSIITDLQKFRYSHKD